MRHSPQQGRMPAISLLMHILAWPTASGNSSLTLKVINKKILEDNFLIAGAASATCLPLQMVIISRGKKQTVFISICIRAYSLALP